MKKDYRIDIVSLITDEDEFEIFFRKNEKKIRKLADKMLKMNIYGLFIHIKDENNIAKDDIAFQ